MAEHLPGPWTVDGPPHNQIVWATPNVRVCFLAHSDGADNDRDIATGLVIAAAPDLLAALERAVKLSDVSLPHFAGRTDECQAS